MAAGKVAVITGAAQGLGKSFTEALLTGGGKVFKEQLQLTILSKCS